jgi:hypothetical protein
VQAKKYTVLLTTHALVELYNPGWAGADKQERGAKMAEFIGEVPSVIVNVEKIFEAELKADLVPLETLPVELDLRTIPSERRSAGLLALLRADEWFVQRGKDIRTWAQQTKQLKAGWLADVDRIIADAVETGNLVRRSDGTYGTSREEKERFLFSLDFRHAKPEDVGAILKVSNERIRAGNPSRLPALRLYSLCFWHAYVDVDKAHRIPRKGSDLIDLLHISLIPYCAAMAVDSKMRKMLDRIRAPTEPTSCNVFSQSTFEKILEYYR